MKYLEHHVYDLRKAISSKCVTNFKYVKDMRFGKIRGGYKGFRIKTDCLVEL